MIRQDETDLTSEQYEAVKTHDGLFAAQTILEQRSLEFVLQADGQVGGGSLFDADRLSDGRIVKSYLNGTTLAAIALADAPDAEWEAIGAIATNVTRIRPSIGGDYVFYLTDSGIYRRSLGTFPEGEAELVASSSQNPLQNKEVTHLAAADDSTVFVALYDQTNYTTNLQMFTLSGNWGDVNTEIYWPRRLTGLDAIALEDGAHLFVISSDLPPLIGQQVEGTTVRRVAERRNGLVAWRMQNWRSSDHFLIDSFDDASAYQYRQEPRLSKLPDGRIVLTAYGSDGKANSHHAALHYYFSLDGRAWSHNHMINLPATSNGAPMVIRGYDVYLVGDTAVYHAKGTALTGNLHPDLVEDITSLILSYSSDQTGARQTTYEVKNTGWLAGSLLNKAAQLQIKTRLGVWHNGTKALVPVSTELIDVISPSREKPSERVVIQARDHFALLNGLVRSPHSREYDTQVMGADKYYDFTGTGYGGLAHTAGVLGSWSTVANWLVLRSNNKRSVAFNTFKADAMWCGMIQATIQVDNDNITPDSPEDKEYGGLVFRAYDKDNYMAWEYVPELEWLRLSRYANGKREYVTHVPVDWGYGVPGHLRVVFRYSKVMLYYSNDGHDWTYFGQTILPGKPPSVIDVPDGPLYYEDGLVGFCGLGYSKDDVWPEPPDTPYIPPSTPGETAWGIGTKSAIIALRAETIGNVENGGIYGVIAVTRSATTGPWTLLHDGIQTLHNGRPAEIANMHLDPFSFGSAYLTFRNGDTYYNPDWRNGAAWQLIASALDLQAAFNDAHGTGYDYVQNMVVSMAAEGHVLLTVRALAANGRERAALIRIRHKQSGIDVSPMMRWTKGDYAGENMTRASAHFGNRVPGLVMATADWDFGRHWHGVWICDWTTTGKDWTPFQKATYDGQTFWIPTFQMEPTGTKYSAIGAPYTKLDGTPNENDQQIFWYGPGDRIWKSENQGVSFAPFSESGIAPRAPQQGAFFDQFEVNAAYGPSLHMIRASNDINAPDQLILSNDAGNSYRSISLPMKNYVGWSGGFPGRDSQFYIGANRWEFWGDNALHALPPNYKDHPWLQNMPAGRDMILGFTKDGGQTWSNWTHNLWNLVAQTAFNHICRVGVVRMYPHPLER